MRSRAAGTLDPEAEVSVSWASPTERYRTILAAFAQSFVWPCKHGIELRQDRGLRCAACDALVRRRS
jgi:hypothetical protein